jgi:hypothetical protein
MNTAITAVPEDQRRGDAQVTDFLSEIVQYRTAIYPEPADHQKVQLTLKPILPQGCDHIKEEVKMKFNFMKRMVIAPVTGTVLLLGTCGLAISQEQNPQHNAQRQEQQRNAQQQQRATRQHQRQGTQQWQQEQERRQQRVQQQGLNQYSQQRRQLDRHASAIRIIHVSQLHVLL